MNKDEFIVDAATCSVEEDDRTHTALLKWARRAFSSPDVIALRISRVYAGRPRRGSKLKQFLRRVFGTEEILKEIELMTVAMDHLQAEVSRATSVMQSATTLITTVAGNIRANAEDPAALNALADQLDASAVALSTAVTENTAAANLGGSTDHPSGQDPSTGDGGAAAAGAGDATGGDATGGDATGGEATGGTDAGAADAGGAGTGSDTTGASGDEQP